MGLKCNIRFRTFPRVSKELCFCTVRFLLIFPPFFSSIYLCQNNEFFLRSFFYDRILRCSIFVATDENVFLFIPFLNERFHKTFSFSLVSFYGVNGQFCITAPAQMFKLAFFYHCPCPPVRDLGSRVSGLGFR